MLSSLRSAVSGIRQFQNGMDVIGNNISNSNTFGFRSGYASFEDTFSLKQQGASASTGTSQIGTGVRTSSIKSTWSVNGPAQATGNETDLYINGDGFFIVNDSAGKSHATRAGDFLVDPATGNMITTHGLKLQGFKATAEGSETPFEAATSDLVIDTKNLEHLNIDKQGKIVGRYSDKAGLISLGQVALQKFSNPQQLEKEGGNTYTNLEAAGPLLNPVAPSSAKDGSGEIWSGSLEVSNVDLTTEFANMITMQRGFQANARVITTSDEMLQEVVNLKH